MKRLIDSIFRSQYRPLCIYAIHYVGNTDEAEDIVSACFAMLWERMAGGVKIENPKAYLYSAVRNSCIDKLRKAQSETFLPRDLDGLISDDEARDRSGIEARLWDTIDKMPERRRKIFLMAKREGMSYSEIATSLGISESTVRNTMEVALRSLKGARKEILQFVVFL